MGANQGPMPAMASLLAQQPAQQAAATLTAQSAPPALLPQAVPAGSAGAAVPISPSSSSSTTSSSPAGKSSKKKHKKGFYGQGTHGDLNLHNAKIALNKVTRLSKGTQHDGIILCGILNSKVQHHKISYASVSEEQRVVSASGVVASPERWAFHSRHAKIRAIVQLLPARPIGPGIRVGP